MIAKMVAVEGLFDASSRALCLISFVIKFFVENIRQFGFSV